MAVPQSNSQFGTWANRYTGLDQEPQQPQQSGYPQQFSPFGMPQKSSFIGPFGGGGGGPTISFPITPGGGQPPQPPPAQPLGSAPDSPGPQTYGPGANEVLSHFNPDHIGRLEDTAGAQGWTPYGQSVYDYIQQQKGGAQDNLNRQLAQIRSESRANLSRSGLDSGEAERLNRSNRRSGITGMQNLERAYDQATQYAKSQDEALKQRANQQLLDLQRGQADAVAGENRRIEQINADNEYNESVKQASGEAQSYVDDALKTHGDTPETREKIKRELRKAGWDDDDINSFLGERDLGEGSTTNAVTIDDYDQDINRLYSTNTSPSVKRDFKYRLESEMPNIVHIIKNHQGNRNQLVDQLMNYAFSKGLFTRGLAAGHLVAAKDLIRKIISNNS